MNDFEYNPNRISSHAGFRYGVTGGLIMVFVHLMLLLIFRGTNQGDLIAWFIAWFVYLMIGRMAAQAQYDCQQDGLDATRGVENAGQGAAMVTSFIIWGFIIVRAVFRDAVGYFIIAEPISLCVAIFVDVIIALGLGRWGGMMVANKYRISNDY